MNGTSWLTAVGRALIGADIGRIVRLSKGPYKKGLHQVNCICPTGTRIYDQDWDVLVIVDACRLDLFEEIAHKYAFVEAVGSMRSVASVTKRWMQLNFTAEYHGEMAETAYVCGNPHSEAELRAADFARLEEVWRDAWVPPGTVPPEAVTNAAIEIGREMAPPRMIVHYMQPHCPFVSRPELSKGKALDQFGNQKWNDVWQRLEKGEIAIEDVWDGYRDNLRLALDEVDVLLDNVDAETVVVSSDHGNAIGEWGLYGHLQRMPFECLRTVPHVETTATDDRTRVDLNTAFDSNEELTVDQRLKSLGYV